jgi:hypothetical protein
VKVWILLLAMAVSGSLGCAAQVAEPPAVATPVVTIPVLVELFTSEGCSSCPPADAILATLDGKISPTGQQVIALEEHVTYWNRLGWIDPFSLEFFSDRQNTYTENTGKDEVYTPQVVVNGSEEALGSDMNAVLLAIRMAGRPLALDVNVLSYAPNGKSLSVVFSVAGKLPREGVDVFAVLADDRDSTQVARGENAGRTLAHVAVARSVGKGVVLNSGEQALVSIPISPSLRAQPEGGRRLVLIVQQRGQGKVVGLASEEISVDFAKVPEKAGEQSRTLETR